MEKNITSTVEGMENGSQVLQIFAIIHSTMVSVHQFIIQMA